MSNEAAVIDAKDADVFLLLICALEQLKYFLQSWYMVTDSNRFIKIMMYSIFVSEICDVVQELHATINCDTTSYKFNVEKLHVLKMFVKNSPDARIKC